MAAGSTIIKSQLKMQTPYHFSQANAESQNGSPSEQKVAFFKVLN
jgi:hypothetical protein